MNRPPSHVRHFARRGWLGYLLLGLVPVFGVESAEAQLALERLTRHHPEFARRVLTPRMNAGKSARLIVRRADARASTRVVHLSDNFVVVSAKDHGSFSAASWTPPKRLLLDEAQTWIGLEPYRQQLLSALPNEVDLGRGRGVTVGIVDGGVDLRHPDLRHADGTTRAAWLLDFAAAPLGFHPDLEEQYGCTDPDTPCCILSAVEIDRALAGADDVVLPPDRLGHGTHVASIAIGGGQSNSDYEGIAPEATLIVARLSVDSVEVQDADVLLASRFVYDRSDELAQPAVVNLSLGGDFGPHDGSTTMERALVSLVDRPGRAMVVAAGNSGTLYNEGPSDLVGPFGIHTDVTLVGEKRVAIAVPRGQSEFDGDILVWVDTKPNQSLAVGVESEMGVVVEPVGPGESAEGSTGDWDVLVSNETSLGDDLVDWEGGTLLIFTGNFQEEEVIHLKLVGNAQTSLWLQSSGELTNGTPGALFGMARQGGTITVPATAPELIAVGASLNRSSWPSRANGAADLAIFSEQLDDEPGSVAFFSSLGPNHSGNLKPDILAPGAIVIAAMAPSADPRPPGGTPNAISMFGYSPICEIDAMCAVVDDNYAVAVGTSMAAPVVSGAVALLLAQNPSLTQSQIQLALRAGVTKQAPSKTTLEWEKTLPAAPGSLQLARAAQVLQLLESARQDSATPTRAQSWLAFADAYVAPGASIEGSIWTRGADNAPADVDEQDLNLTVSNGRITEGPRRLAPGLFHFIVRASEDASLDGQDGLRVRVRLDDTTLADTSVPIAGDLGDVRGVPRTSPRLREESCAVAPPRRSHTWGVWVTALLLASFMGRRRLTR